MLYELKTEVSNILLLKNMTVEEEAENRES